MTDYSAIILAGGKSSRMGQKKSTLLLEGRTFIDILIDKLKRIGIEEILISGFEYENEKCIYVEDIYKDKGPLAGIHAGLDRMSRESALVLTEDAPLIPEDFIQELISEHKKNGCSITVARSNDRIQPLLGIYDKTLVLKCEEILQGERVTVMSLIEKETCATVQFTGEELLIRGCNTPEEYRRLGVLK